MTRITLSLPAEVRDALWRLSEREFRHPRDQAALIIRLELERRGLLPPADPHTAANDPHPAQPEAAR